MNKTKDAIFEAAIKVFSQNGYNKATMDEIALNAGVAKGTLYYHFKSKEEIFKYIIKEGMKIIKNEIEETSERIKEPVDKLKAISRIQLEIVHKNRDFFKVIMSQLWGQELRQLELREAIGNYIRYIESFLRAAMEDGCIKGGETKFMAYTFFGNLCSAAVYELMSDECENVGKLQENLMHYIFEGIGIK